uniref:Uncharacterized protein n=1 Tax=Pavo cristatus TaxID=9049 RepID=A0A8C9F691_PAVCR
MSRCVDSHSVPRKSGRFPVYDYELPVTEEALNASIARINSQSWGPYLYGIVRSHVRHVSVQTTETLYLKYALQTWKTGFLSIFSTCCHGLSIPVVARATESLFCPYSNVW